MTAPQLIYIAGLPHSGSTLLDLACSSGGIALSLGEVQKSLKAATGPTSDAVCSCGAGAAECPFWSGMAGRPADMPRAEFRAEVMQAAARFAPDARFVVDSSKSTEGLRSAAHLKPIVLHVVKDVRAFVVSKIDIAAMKARKPIVVGREMRGWADRNRQISDLAVELGLRYLAVSYDALCLESEAQAARVNTFVGAPVMNAGNLLGSERHHILVGNRMKHAAGQGVRYDRRWMGREEWVWPYALNPGVRRMNRSLVAGV